MIDVAVLYRLSLAIGQSTDLRANCDSFLAELMLAEQLDAASVWLRYRLLTEEDDAEGGAARDTAVLAFARPQTRFDTESVAPDHRIFQLLARHDPCSVAAPDPAFAEVAVERAVSRGAVALFGLGDLGFLKLHSASRQAPFPAADLADLATLMGRFTASLASCLDLNRLQREVVLRRRAEAAIRYSEEYFRSLIENALDLILVLGFDATIRFASPSVRRVLGYLPEDLEGRNLLELVASDELIEVRARFMAQVRRDGISPPFELRLRHRTGGWRTVSASTNNLLAVPSVGGVIVNCHDVTEKAVLTAELDRARQAAIEASRAKGEFLANMSHEIRTPMNAVIGMARLLGETELAADQRDFVDTITASGEALLAIINDILDFSKVEAGMLDIERAPFALRDAVADAVDLLAPTAAGKGLDLAWWVDGSTPEVLVGDASRLRQILVNLIGNAVKFTAAGGVLVTVAGEAVAGGRYQLHLTVEDTGPGIAAEAVDRLFRPFSQVDGSSTRRHGGSGLGLAICRRLADLMGGRTWVESELGRGSTFHVTVLVEVGPPASDAAVAADVELLHGRRLLLVDDSPFGRRTVALALRSWGVEVAEAATCEAACALLAGGQDFDGALVDLAAAGAGEALASALRRRAGDRPLPLVLLRPLGLESRGGGEGWDGVVAKPVKPQQLAEGLVAVLRLGGGPRVERRAAAPRRDAGAEVAALRILLAEDNLVNQKVALATLRSIGYEATVVGTGAAALRVAVESVFDVILMDVQMPDMDGLEATRRIRAAPLARQPRIIAMTAHAMAGDRERCLAAGMDGYVAKPIDRAELASALAAAGGSRAASPRPE